MAKRITAVAIENLKPGAVRRELPAGGGLYVVIAPSGRKGFAVRYRFRGRTRRLVLQSGVTLAQARKLAADAMFEVARGNDPGEARKAAQQQAELAAADTVAAVCREYIRREHAKLRTARPRESVLERLVYPAIGKRPIEDVRRSEIVRMLDRIEDDCGARTADVTLSIVRRVFHWHARRSDTFRSPIVPGMARHSTAAHARARVLSDDELRALWRATETATPYHTLLRFLLLVGCRRGEAVGMTWNELADGVWTLPARRNKTGHELVRPLSAAALTLLDAQPRIVSCSYVFSHGRVPLGGLSRSKRNLDAATGVAGWTIHDLRRTARSLLSRAGVNADIAERCLGHVIGGVRGTYDRHQYQAEMLHAFEALAALLERIVAPQPNVVSLRTSA
jgi:integrase